MKFLVILCTSVLVCFHAQAQMACAERSDILSRLDGQYSEVPVAMGLANNGGVIEVLSSPDGNTWTIIVTDTHGMSCLLAAGEYWGPAAQKQAHPAGKEL